MPQQKKRRGDALDGASAAHHFLAHGGRQFRIVEYDGEVAAGFFEATCPLHQEAVLFRSLMPAMKSR